MPTGHSGARAKLANRNQEVHSEFASSPDRRRSASKTRVNALVAASRNDEDYFAIAGARSTAARYCGRMSVFFALSWIGGRGSFAVPGSMMKV